MYPTSDIIPDHDLAGAEAVVLDRVQPAGPLKAMPAALQKKFGTALLDVQYGDTPYRCQAAQGLRGRGCAGDHGRIHTDTFRAVYTVTLASGVCVLHVFQKKSKHGLGTPRRDIDLVKRRYQLAREHDARMEAR